MKIVDKATTAGTERIANRHPELTYLPLGQTGLQVSEVGFGGYRINLNSGPQEQALRFALQQGINLIDTSANYTDGGSERLIGRVLQELIEAGELRRDEVVVVSKAGYVQGFNYALAEQRKQEGRPFPNLVKYSQNLDHCIHPTFLADQLRRSLERLNLETLDGYLLHNPEYYLMWAKRAHATREAAREEYYRRIEEAFLHLEQEVADGRIQWYGISSNTFAEPDGHFTHTSLARVQQIAAGIGPNHHFRLAQLPMNLFETGAATVPNQPHRQTFLGAAQAEATGVMVNRPLNAFHQEALVRLSHVSMPNYPAPAEDVSTAVDTLLPLETQFQQQVLPQLPLDEESEKVLQEYLALGLMLDGRWGSFGTYQNWLDIRSLFILKRMQTAIEFLSNLENPPPALLSWLDEYVEAANIALAAVTAYYQEQAARRTALIKETVETIEPEWQAATLSQTAVRALRSTAGVSVVLVGMRHQYYVEDMVADLKNPVAKKERLSAWRQLQNKVTDISS